MYCTCTRVFDGEKKKPTLPGCISVTLSIQPPAWPLPDLDTNPFQPCLNRVLGKPGLMGTCSWASIATSTSNTPFRPYAVIHWWLPEPWSECVTVKCGVRLQSGKGGRREPKGCFGGGEHMQYMHKVLLTGTGERKPCLTDERDPLHWHFVLLQTYCQPDPFTALCTGRWHIAISQKNPVVVYELFLVFASLKIFFFGPFSNHFFFTFFDPFPFQVCLPLTFLFFFYFNIYIFLLYQWNADKYILLKNPVFFNSF